MTTNWKLDDYNYPTPLNSCLIIVAYNPASDFYYNLDDFKSITNNIVVVDNSDNPEIQLLVKKLCIGKQISLISNKKNLGIAKALNQGIEFSKQANKDWVLLFDQDSLPRKNFFTSLEKWQSQKMFSLAIIGSNYDGSLASKLYSNHIRNDPSSTFVERKTVITSGSIIPMKLIDKIGVFREDYFIDSVDHEYCLRARKHGYKVLLRTEISMDHKIGNEGAAALYGKTLVPLHSAFRKYYIARNTITTVRQYFFSDTAWCCKQILRLLVELTSTVLLEPDRQKRVYLFFKGVSHAAIGKMGPMQ